MKQSLCLWCGLCIPFLSVFFFEQSFWDIEEEVHTGLHSLGMQCYIQHIAFHEPVWSFVWLLSTWDCLLLQTLHLAAHVFHSFVVTESLSFSHSLSLSFTPLLLTLTVYSSNSHCPFGDHLKRIPTDFSVHTPWGISQWPLMHVTVPNLVCGWPNENTVLMETLLKNSSAMYTCGLICSFLHCFLWESFFYADLFYLRRSVGGQVKIFTVHSEVHVLKFIIFSTFNKSYLFIP